MRPTDALGMPAPRFSLQELQRQPQQIQAAYLQSRLGISKALDCRKFSHRLEWYVRCIPRLCQFVSMSFANRFTSIFGVRYIQNDFAFDACGATRG